MFIFFSSFFTICSSFIWRPLKYNAMSLSFAYFRYKTIVFQIRFTAKNVFILASYHLIVVVATTTITDFVTTVLVAVLLPLVLAIVSVSSIVRVRVDGGGGSGSIGRLRW